MKKRLIAFLLTALMLTPSVSAHTDEQVNTADALNNLGLFLGTGVDYNLDGKLSRAEGITLLVRMIGQEKTANSYDYSAPFTDVPAWATAYVNYAWLNAITNGVSGTEFGSETQMEEYMFLTLTLRMLGHKDSGENPEFTWDHPYELAQSVGLIDKNVIDTEFTRGDAITVFWNALTLNDNALAKDLIAREIFTLEEFNEAADVKANGRKENVGVPIVPETDDDKQTGGVGIIGGDPIVGGDITVPEPDDSDDSDKDDTDIQKPSSGENDNSGSDKPSSGETGNSGSDKPSSGENDNGGSTTTPPADSDDNKEPETPAEKAPTDYTYEEYEAMTGEEQQKLLSRFDSMADFFTWLNAAKAEYEANQDIIEIGGDGTIDLGDLIGGKG